MWRPFKKSFRLHLPNAKLVIDKFHVVRMASEALDTERKALQSSLDRDARLNMKKHLRWILLRRPNSLTEDQQRILGNLEKWHPEFKEAYDLKEQFYNIYEATVNGNLKLTPFTLKQQSKIDPFDDLLRLNLWLNSYSLFIF